VAAHRVTARAARATDPALVVSAPVAAEQACSCSSLRKKASARTVVTRTVSARAARFKGKSAAARTDRSATDHATADRAAQPALAAGSERKRLFVQWRLVQLLLAELGSKRKRQLLLQLLLLRLLL
jgi:hypothetical protein